MQGEYRGLQKDIKKLKIEPPLDVVENEYADRDYLVVLQTEELNTVCPKTGLPDFAVLKIEYVPDKWLVEQKSLKLYLTAYRNIGIFQEHATNKIFDDFIETVKPRWARIEARWNARGGISTVVVREYKPENSPYRKFLTAPESR